MVTDRSNELETRAAKESGSGVAGSLVAGTLIGAALGSGKGRFADAVRSRLPATAGEWVGGTPGHGTWKPKKAIKLPGGAKVTEVPFRDGFPVFDQWSKGEVYIAITGDDKFDRAQAQKVWKKKGRKLLDEHVFHHDGRIVTTVTHQGKQVVVGRMQIVPKTLNDVSHVGSASIARHFSVSKEVAEEFNELAIKGKGKVLKAAKKLKRLAAKPLGVVVRGLPFFGTAYVLWEFSDTVEAHGFWGAVLRATPAVGTVVTAYDLGSAGAEGIRAGADDRLTEAYADVNDPVRRAHAATADDTVAALEEIGNQLDPSIRSLDRRALAEAIKEPVHEFYTTMYMVHYRLFGGRSLNYPGDARGGPQPNEDPFEMRLRMAKEALERALRIILVPPTSSDEPPPPRGPIA